MSIDEKLDLILATQAAIMDLMPKPEASERELNGERGDPELKVAPKRCAYVKGKRMSQLGADDLESVAELFDFFAKKNLITDAKKAGWDMESARLARGWARRKRSGWKPAPSSNAALFGDPDMSDDTPF